MKRWRRTAASGLRMSSPLLQCNAINPLPVEWNAISQSCCGAIPGEDEKGREGKKREAGSKGARARRRRAHWIRLLARSHAWLHAALGNRLGPRPAPLRNSLPKSSTTTATTSPSNVVERNRRHNHHHHITPHFFSIPVKVDLEAPKLREDFVFL